jgi:CheY-like chemotaxis protein
VFEEFYQVDNPERDRAKGLGLGLSIVRRLCQLLGIALELHSAAGEGTRVTLRLPTEAGTADTPRPRAAPERPSFKGVMVLVVDAERSVRTGMRILLEELGCGCVEAGSVQEAVQQALAMRPHIMLADLRLRHGESGIAAIAGVVEAIAPTPALLVSGDTAPDRLLEARRAGIKLLHKPLSLPALQDELARLLSERV